MNWNRESDWVVMSAVQGSRDQFREFGDFSDFMWKVGAAVQSFVHSQPYEDIAWSCAYNSRTSAILGIKCQTVVSAVFKRVAQLCKSSEFRDG